MKDKLEPNMYVRTKHNGIGKIVEYINDPTHYFFKCYKLDRKYTNYEEYITEVDVLKASHNIIDLIEVGDYVNGRLVYKNDEENYLYLIGFDADGNFYEDSIKDIKSIVTKEQMEQMAYKVGD